MQSLKLILVKNADSDEVNSKKWEQISHLENVWILLFLSAIIRKSSAPL